jgi:hypothetical protein
VGGLFKNMKYPVEFWTYNTAINENILTCSKEFKVSGSGWKGARWCGRAGGRCGDPASASACGLFAGAKAGVVLIDVHFPR